MERLDRLMSWACPYLRRGSQVLLACVVGSWAAYGFPQLVHVTPWASPVRGIAMELAWAPKW